MEQDIWLCPWCELRFESSILLNQHFESQHSIGEGHQPYICSVCNTMFVKKLFLTNHLCEMHGFDPTKETDSNISLHIDPAKIFKDPVDRRFKCEECDVYLKSVRTLGDHNKQHHQKESHNHFCTECDWSTFEATRLRKHYLAKHAERNIKCNQCSAKFACKTLLTSHVRRLHERRFLHSCPECGEKLRTVSLLRKHCLNKHQILITKKQFQLQQK